MWRGVLRVLFSPVMWLLARLAPVDDPWERQPLRVPLRLFGSGIRRDFGWFFEGGSRVQVRSLTDIQDWLGGCEYTSDMHLFQEPDFWQHPRTFEQVRRGDCEDFALWSWRKLLELGYDADFVVGRTVLDGNPGHTQPVPGSGRHAWIVFREGGTSYVFEPTQRDRMRAVQELQLVRALYVPEFGAGPDRKTFLFAGYLISYRSRGRHQGPRHVERAAQRGAGADEGRHGQG